MKNLMAAFLKAQQDFPALVYDAINPAFKARYASLGAVQDAAFPTLRKHGLVVYQHCRTEMTDKGPIVYVGATLCHVESGEQLTQELGLVPSKQDPQGIGSAITYGRRFVLMTALGLVADDDDDGNAASTQPAPRSAPPAKPPAQPAQPTQAQPPADALGALKAQVHTAGARLYGGIPAWEKKQPASAQWASNKRTDKIGALNEPELRQLLAELERQIAKQQPQSEIHY